MIIKSFAELIFQTPFCNLNRKVNAALLLFEYFYFNLLALLQLTDLHCCWGWGVLRCYRCGYSVYCLLVAYRSDRSRRQLYNREHSNWFACCDPHIGIAISTRMATRVDSRIICQTLGNDVALYKVVSIPISDAIVLRSGYNCDLTFGANRFGSPVHLNTLWTYCACDWNGLLERCSRDNGTCGRSRKAQKICRNIHC